MVQHTPWVGEDYKTGIDGQRICIVGYSHHHEKGESDSDDLTEWVVRQVIEGELGKNSFFPSIPGYFGFPDPRTFWNRVIFFNFLPNCIGETDQRYGTGGTDQTIRGQKRFLQIIRESNPTVEKVFVFTVKGWRDLSRKIEEESGKEIIPLSTEFPKFSWGTYTVDGHTVRAFGLRHPQFAPFEMMRSAVQQILEKPRIEKD
jgi:hypothetical protein